MTSFSGDRSTTIRAPPLGLGTKKPLEHQSLGSEGGTGSMSLFLMASAKTLSAAGLRCSGICGAVYTFLG